MGEMFCFQCEQTAGCKACTGKAGVCGKTAEVANLQDDLTRALIGLALAVNGKPVAQEVAVALMTGLFTTLTNVSFDPVSIAAQTEDVKALADKFGGMPSACSNEKGMLKLWSADEDIRSLKSLILLGLRGMGAYAYHAHVLGKYDHEVNAFFVKGMAAIGDVDATADTLLPVVMELGSVNVKCMALLEAGNLSTFGTPVPTKVSMTVQPGPFIVISGHDLQDLQLLLEQTKDKGVSIYTHGEMLPAHAYPELKKYAHLKGNFGTAWQNQQKEFADVPGAFLFTTNCIMPVRDSYADRVFTTSVVAYPGLVSIGKDKDFTPVIEKALALGGYKEPVTLKGINGGDTMTTGFGRETILANAGTIIDAVKAKAIRHFFLVGGCDGAKPGRNYYTEFVKQTPADTIILTLACGKYRFNDLDLGSIGPFPRILDMGQCNDAYGAVQVALALAGAFECGVNDLPLTLVLSWYEQKAVCILLSLLSLGIKNIYIGPSLPAFISPNILNFLVEKFNLTPISTPEADLKKILG